MPLKLTNPDIISGVVTDEKISSFTTDLKNSVIYIVFDRLDADGNIVVPDVTHVIADAEMIAAITRAGQIAQADVYAALKQALYEFLPGNGEVV